MANLPYKFSRLSTKTNILHAKEQTSQRPHHAKQTFMQTQAIQRNKEKWKSRLSIAHTYHSHSHTQHLCKFMAITKTFHVVKDKTFHAWSKQNLSCMIHVSKLKQNHDGTFGPLGQKQTHSHTPKLDKNSWHPWLSHVFNMQRQIQYNVNTHGFTLMTIQRHGNKLTALSCFS